MVPSVVLILALAAMFVPTYMNLAKTAWGSESNGHGPMILALSLWLLWRDRAGIFAASTKPAMIPAFLMIVPAVLMYIIGRSQSIDTLDTAMQVPMLIGCILMMGGWGALKRAWFPIFFLIFMVPLPGVFVQMLTLPLKAAVSYVAEHLLYWVGYPIGRTGVTLTVGPYELLVADACSGLNSLFTLESLGLFYMKLMNYQSKARNTILAVMIIPISFISNVIRVITLVLITYHLGDEAGQGFMHGFAGMVLFTVALILTYALDRLLAARFDKSDGVRGALK